MVDVIHGSDMVDSLLTVVESVDSLLVVDVLEDIPGMPAEPADNYLVVVGSVDNQEDRVDVSEGLQILALLVVAST